MCRKISWAIVGHFAVGGVVWSGKRAPLQRRHTGVSSVCSTICSGADQIKHQSSVSLDFVRTIHRWPVDSPHKGPVTRKCFRLTSPWEIVKSSRNFGKIFLTMQSAVFLFIACVDKVMTDAVSHIYRNVSDICRLLSRNLHLSPRDHFVNAPSQRETTLHCNVVSPWLGAYTKWSLQS